MMTVMVCFACSKTKPSAIILPGTEELYPGVPKSDIYEVSIGGAAERKLVVFQNSCPVFQEGFMNMEKKDQNPLNIFKNRTISWTHFSFSGTITVFIRLKSNTRVSLTSNTRVLPSRYGITPVVEGSVIKLELTKPGQYSVELGEDGYKNGLMIFADPVETDKPDIHSADFKVLSNAKETDLLNPSAQTGLYFKAGVHHIGVYQVPENIKNIYLEEGAWVYGALRMDHNPGVRIYGRGVLSGDELNYRESHSIEAINQSDNIKVEGIVVADPRYFAIRLIGKNNRVDRVKVIGGWTYNCDGISAFEGSTISNCFIWANDDNLKLYRNNITVTDCVCWQLNNGGIIQLSWGNGNATNVTVSRLDILHAEWNNDELNRGVVSCVGDKFEEGGMYGLQKNFVIENVVTETAVPLIFRLSPDPSSLNEIEGMVFRNWNVKMDMSKGFHNYIIGTDGTHPFKGIVFDNFVLNGTLLNAGNWISTGNFVVNNIEPPLFY